MFLRFYFAIASTENNWSKITYTFNEFSLLISLQFSLEIVRVFKKGKEKKILLLESLRDRPNCITIVIVIIVVVGGRWKDSRVWEEKLEKQDRQFRDEVSLYLGEKFVDGNIW